MKRRVIVLLFLLAAACASAPPAAQGPVHVVIVGTTDVHGWLAGHQRDNPSYGGLPVLASYVNALRAANQNRVLVVDSGDLYQGTLESNLFEGEPITLAYNAIGYTAAAIGNHEFDYGPVGPDPVPRHPDQDPLGALKHNVQLAKFQFLSANIVDKTTHDTPSWEKRSIITNVDGVKIGIIGLTTPDTPATTVGANITSLDFTDPAAAAVREAKHLRDAGADAVIVIAHMGGKCSDMNDVNDVASCEPDHEVMRFLRAIPPGTIDGYFAGHTHQQVRQIINGVPVVQALAYGHSFSAIDFWIDPAAHKVTKSELRSHTMLCTQVFTGTDTCDPRRAPKDVTTLVPRVFEGVTITPDAKVAALIDPYMKKVEAKRNEKTGITTATKLTRDYEHESQVGDLLADALRDFTKADFAMVNSGGIRTDLRQGDLIYSDFFEMQPFDNYPAVVQITGAQIADILKITTASDRGLVQVSGLRYTKDNHKLTALTDAGGNPLDPDKLYRLATIDFLANGGDGWIAVTSKIPPERISIDQSHPMRDAIIEAVKKWPQPVNVKLEGRVTVVEPPK